MGGTYSWAPGDDGYVSLGDDEYPMDWYLVDLLKNMLEMVFPDRLL